MTTERLLLKLIIFEAAVILLALPLSEAETVARVDGDINIAGLFGIQAKDGNRCGQINVDSVMVLEAVRWYLERLNLNSSLPFKIGFRGYKTCGITNMAVEKTLDIIRLHSNFQATGAAEDFFVGLIGPGRSEEAKNVASLLSSRAEEKRFLQLSFSATASVLEDRRLYPNFYRVIPDDSKQIKTMALLMTKLGWNRIGIVYENDTYGRNGALSLQDRAQDNQICVSQMHAINVTSAGDVPLEQIDTALDNIMLHTPVIQAVVLVASKNVANKILFKVDNKGVANVPIFLLSESVGLEGDVFKSSGALLQKMKGSIIVSAPYLEVTSFTDYWMYLFTNMTILEVKAILNPWLIDVLAFENGCNPNASCQALTLEEAKDKFSVQSVYLQYGILAAHTMAKALFNVYKNLCPGTSDCLQTFKNNFKPHMMIDSMDGLTIDFETDFQASVEPLSSSRYRMTFGLQSEPVSRSDQEVYQIFNYRRSSDENNYRNLEVGRLNEDSTLSLDFDILRDYDAAGREMTFPNLRRGQCPVGERCSECIRTDVTDLILHVPGDFYIIGTAPINNKAIPGPLGCGSIRVSSGYQVALAMETSRLLNQFQAEQKPQARVLKYGIQSFNSIDEFADNRQKFGGKRIGLIVLNSCNNDLNVVQKLLALHNRMGVTLNNGEFLDLKNRILGYVGCLSSGVSLPVATQLSKLGYVQVSYASTKPALSDKEKYPYFMRIVNPDSVQAEAMMEVVKALRGEYIQVVYNEGAYGIGGRDSVTESAEKRGICIAQNIEVKESDRYFEYYELLRKKPHARIVIIFVNSNVLLGLLRDLNQQMIKGEFQFIGSEAWGKTADLLQYGITKGALTVTLEMDGVKGLTSFIQNKVPVKDTSDPWLEQFIQNRQNCYLDWSFDKDKTKFPRVCADDILPPAEKGGFQADPWAVFATTSVYSLLLGSSEFFSKSCGNADKLCEHFVTNPSGLVKEMKKVSMDIFGTGQIQIFDSVGDGNMGYQIYNIQEDPSDSESLKYTRVGRFNLNAGLEINPSNVAFPTSEDIVSLCPNEQACADCHKKETNMPETSPEISDSLAIALGSVVGILVVIIIVLIVVFIIWWRKHHKDDPYITPSGDILRPNTIGKSDSPYHSDEIIQETHY